MKNQYHADDRDIAKWTLVRQACANVQAKGGGAVLHYAAMLTPDDGGNDGNHLRSLAIPADFRDHGVAAFFEQERTLIRQGAPRAVARLAGLIGGWQGVAYRPHLDVFSGTAFGRAAWFDRVAAVVAADTPGTPRVLLVDPDNGVGVASVREKHHKQVREDELARLAGLMRPGDRMLVYTHRNRGLGEAARWQAHTETLAARCLPGARTRAVHPFSDLSFLLGEF